MSALRRLAIGICFSGACLYVPQSPEDEGICASHDDCDDGLVCNGIEVCDPLDASAGDDGCAPGAPPTCEDAGACVLAACVEPDGCVWSWAGAETACDDGVDCTVDDRCDGAGACAGEPDDGACPGDECEAGLCDPVWGCALGPATSGQPCAVDSCLLDSACDGDGACLPGISEAPDGTSCEGELACEGDAQCSSYTGQSACACVCADGAQILWTMDGLAEPAEMSHGVIDALENGDGQVEGPFSCADDLLAVSSSFLSAQPIAISVSFPCGDDWGALEDWRDDIDDGKTDERTGALIFADADGNERSRWTLEEVTLTRMTPWTARCEGYGSATFEVGDLEL